MNMFLKNERPEVDKKRSDLLKLQGECKVKLRELEDELLNALNNVQGNILENDTVIATLETLKKEAADIGEEVEKTDETIKEIELVSSVYVPISNMSSRIFFTLENLASVHFLYQYSLQFFMEVVNNVLHKNKRLNEISKDQSDNRLRVITEDIFEFIYRTISVSMLNEHKMLLALRLA
jgi:dynein heavy chain 1